MGAVLLATVQRGTLYICGTPIGNLGDITLRALEVLKGVDLIAAEDTRHSRKLLDHFGIATPLTSYHEHNEKGKALELVRRLEQGEAIALISDAGMPGISDPGQEVIQLCLEKGIPLDVLPGANAGLTALLLSGMPNDHFLFHGFLPSQSGARKKELQNYAQLPFTQIFYEAPHRLVATLEDLWEVFGERETAVVREITKLHQSVHKGTLSTLIHEFKDTAPRGEICVLTSPYIPVPPTGGEKEWRQEVQELTEQGMKPNDAMKVVAQKYGVSKREVYQAVLSQKKN
ncbi:16S rRNA (cytidine(1402)-2'-O)-methyltransferase [Desulfitobacterium hafniense]|uniref:Ribosomal RNA small subunit methyltransferase I n=3 Tax=root TaxID=1 RepID=A0A0W1JPH6_DESHA|nr:16S rRNA (cytidine(1402)-2'-O)-methyltransferase [Desulfitobacterium hafniense]EHL05243.1 S-adenosylmethionine-dependent methyltransferase, YraL family [Desulfitobacterium hafniense DP7]KTE93286.1 16S rRNA methyltransferase [Desulfitobacterium hafniense]MEA5022694.1 16S rRNA (cytidine(1402)-2'-O)-methyltransferase [Desulfitobacterium hafniense]